MITVHEDHEKRLHDAWFDLQAAIRLRYGKGHWLNQALGIDQFILDAQTIYEIEKLAQSMREEYEVSKR